MQVENLAAYRYEMMEKGVHEHIRAIKVYRLWKEKGKQDLPEDHGRHKKKKA